MANSINMPWMIAGYFNCILDQNEKKGGKAHKIRDSLPFINCIADCSLIDAGCIGSTYTWCDGRRPRFRVWERLDRVLLNHSWSQNNTETSVYHLVRSCSDHAPLFITVKNAQPTQHKYFKFFDFRINEPDFLEVVKQAWNFEATGSPIWKFHMKLKNTCKQLSWWSKNHIGNIFDKTKDLENMVAYMEQRCTQDNSEINRMELNKANAQLIMHIKKEEAYWRQKAGMKWFKSSFILS